MHIYRDAMYLKALPLYLSLSLSLSLISPATFATPTVGALADQERIQLKGIKTFDVAEIKRVLFNDLEVITHGAPSGSRLKYVDVLKRRLRAGFLFAGFVDCEVVAQPNFGGDRLTITVTEGERYLLRAGHDLGDLQNLTHPSQSDRYISKLMGGGSARRLRGSSPRDISEER